MLSFLFVILIDLAEESQSRKRIEKEPKVKTEIDVGTQGWQDLDVKQLLESESWREVESHQVSGRIEEIWKRHCTRKGHFQRRDCQLQCRQALQLAFSRHLSDD